MLLQANLSIGYWGNAVHHAVQILNATPRTDQKRSLLEIVFHKLPDYDKLHVFRCLAFHHKQSKSGFEENLIWFKCTFDEILPPSSLIQSDKDNKSIQSDKMELMNLYQQVLNTFLDNNSLSTVATMLAFAMTSSTRTSANLDFMKILDTEKETETN